MSVKEKDLARIERAIRISHQKLNDSESPMKKWAFRTQRFFLMLYHEVIKDDVAIRAQSFSYLTLFSIMPILAGLFLMFGFMSQWGPVQKQFEAFLVSILQPIPDEYRDTLWDFVMEFKDQYVLKVNQKSASIGILALGVMIWIAAKVFFNIEDLMNRVWLAKSARPWLGRIQNFVLTSALLPFFAAVSFSLPSILENSTGFKIGILDQVIPLMMSLVVLSFMYRFFPNVRVSWRSALIGSFFSGVLFGAANVLLKIYFRFGTETAYGKIAALPIIAFLIYVMWFIFILGAEVSFLVQNHTSFTGKKMPSTTIAESQLILALIALLHERFKKGERPISANALAIHFSVPVVSIQKCMRFLLSHRVIVESSTGKHAENVGYVLSHAIETLNLAALIREYLHIPELVQIFDVHPIFKEIFAEFSQIPVKRD